MSILKPKNNASQSNNLARIAKFMNVNENVTARRQVSQDELLKSAWQQTGENLQKALTEYGKKLKETNH